jgi:hypothetical protein
MAKEERPKLCGDAGGRTATGRPCRRRAYRDGLCAQHAGAHPGGRPSVDFSDEQIEQVEKLAAMLPMAKIADFFGIHENTLREKFTTDPRVSVAYTRGRAKVEASMARSVIVAGTNGDLAAAQFYLRTQAGWSDKQKHEVSGPDGGAIPHRVVVEYVDTDDDAE